MNVVGIIKVFLGKFYFTGVEFAMKLRILIFVTLLAVGFSSACFSHKKSGNMGGNVGDSFVPKAGTKA